MSGRFPQAVSIADYWENLIGGKDTISPAPPERWDWRAAAQESAADGGESNRSGHGGFTPHVDCFDHGFFGIAPREAQSMDPQQRLFLQASWAALEDAGYAPSSLSGRKVGVFVGAGNADYPVLMRRDNAPIDVYRGTSFALTAIPNRVSFLLDINGPSQMIDSACSSSLVALHRAVQAIGNGECEMAIAGGVNLLLGPELFIAFSKAGMLSPTGRCRTFDAGADGYVRGEGAAALVLAPLEMAEKNGDYIYGVIRGTAENHGGRAYSFTAPNVRAQCEVMTSAWRQAGIPIGRASLIETHGTGTPLGDPIEVASLKRALSEMPEAQGGNEEQEIWLGALKSHIGHLEAASGIAAVIKAVLALQHRLVPANLHLQTLNPRIGLAETPFKIPLRNRRLGDAETLYAGVSSFGFGGVNAHAVMEARPARRDAGSENRRPPMLIALSAKCPESLEGRAWQLREFLARRRQCLEGTSVEALLDALVDKLQPQLAAEGSAVRDVLLASLGVTVEQLGATVKAIGGKSGKEIEFAQLRGRVTLGELASGLSELINAQAAAGARKPPVLMPQAALPRSVIESATLPEIAFTLMHGRDAMPERLAFTVESMAELEDKLARFTGGQDGAEKLWFRGSVRGRPSGHSRPPALTGEAPAEEIAALARYWSSAKDAALIWEELYPDIARPRKIPLPSYPFRLDRHWYTSLIRRADATLAPDDATAQRRNGQLRNEKPAIGGGAQVEPAPASASLTGCAASPLPAVYPRTAEDAWKDCWQGGRSAPPVSLMALAIAAEQIARQHGGAASLSAILFSKPAQFSGERFLTRTAPPETAGGRPRLQCLIARAKPHVLMQAEISAARFPVRSPEPVNGRRSMEPDRFYGLLSRHGLSAAASYRFAAGVEIADGHITLRGEPGALGLKNAAFWTAFFAALLAGAEALRADGGGCLLPFSIGELTLDTAQTGRIESMTISANERGLDVDAAAKDGQPAISLRGLRLRALSAAAVNGPGLSSHHEAA